MPQLEIKYSANLPITEQLRSTASHMMDQSVSTTNQATAVAAATEEASANVDR